MSTKAYYPINEIGAGKVGFSTTRSIIEAAFYGNNVVKVNTLKEAYELAKNSPGTVVTDNQNALIIDDFVHLQLVDDRCLQILCHRIGHDIGLNESRRLCRSPVGFLQLNSRFYRTKADQL